MNLSGTNCEACKLSTADPRNGRYLHAGCPSCYARSIALIAAHSESARQRRITPEYRKMLSVFFGDHWEDGHKRVKEWARLMKGCL